MSMDSGDSTVVKHLHQHSRVRGLSPARRVIVEFRCLCSTQIKTQSSWSKGISETKSKQQSQCSDCMHRPVASWGNACSMCMHRSVMSQANACMYCMGSKVSSLYRTYLYSSYFLKTLWSSVVFYDNKNKIKNVYLSWIIAVYKNQGY